jgi:hypothetical protein
MPLYSVAVIDRVERTVTVEASDRYDALVRAENRATWLDDTEHESVGVEAVRAHKVTDLCDDMSDYKDRLEA